MHEHPYLNGANKEKLKVGEVVSNEPVSSTFIPPVPANRIFAKNLQGIYVTSEQAFKLGKSSGFGVRLEDPILVTENGGVPLSGRRASSPYEP